MNTPVMCDACQQEIDTEKPWAQVEVRRIFRRILPNGTQNYPPRIAVSDYHTECVPEGKP